MIHPHRSQNTNLGVQNDSEVLTAQEILSPLFEIEPVTQLDPGFLSLS